MAAGSGAGNETNRSFELLSLVPRPTSARHFIWARRWVWYLSAESLDVNLRIRGNQSDCRVANIIRKSRVVKTAKWRLISLYNFRARFEHVLRVGY